MLETVAKKGRLNGHLAQAKASPKPNIQRITALAKEIFKIDALKKSTIYTRKR